MLSDFSKYIFFQVLYNDLKEIERRDIETVEEWIRKTKDISLSISNLVDENNFIQNLNNINLDIVKLYNENKKNYDFLKYIRNKFIGHVNIELIEKTIEWNAEIRFLNIKDTAFLSLFLLETAINSYVKEEDGEHKIFDSELSLLYPSEELIFKKFIDDTLNKSIFFLEQLLELFNIANELVDPEIEDKRLEDYAKKSGKTKFKYIRNKKNR